MIGKKVYKYILFRGVGQYEIIGVDGEYLIAKSLFCDQGKRACIVKINRVDGTKKQFKYVSFMEGCGQDLRYDEDEEVDYGYMWHNDGTYYLNRSECKSSIVSKQVNDCEKRIREKQSKINDLERSIESDKNQMREIKLWKQNTEAEDHAEEESNK